MKFGVHSLVWQRTIEPGSRLLLQKIAQMGFDGVEMPIVDPDTFDSASIRKIFEQEGLELITSVPVKNSLIDPDESVRASVVEHIKTAIVKAYEVGSPIISGVYYCPFKTFVGRSRTEEEWQWAVSGLREAAVFAARYQITLAMEILNRYETFFLNTVDDGIRLIQEIGEPNVKLHLDTYHQNIEEKSIAESIEKAGLLIGHFHASENDRGTPGTGHITWDEVFRALKNVGYDDWVVIESFNADLSWVRDKMNVWRELAEDMDDLARNGVTFLREKAASVWKGECL